MSENVNETARKSLCALLSQVWIAFTIEFDNESERRSAVADSDRFLVSMAFWNNVMQFVGDAGVPFAALCERSGTPRSAMRSHLNGLARWGYVTVDRDREARVRVTTFGVRARAIWQPLAADVERAWERRFGSTLLECLRRALEAIAEHLQTSRPAYLPIVRFGDGMRSNFLPVVENTRRKCDLPTLLSSVLLAFAIEFEADARTSLVLTANVLRVLVAGSARVRDLPERIGISKEAIAAALGFLARRTWLEITTEKADGRTKIAGLTPSGAAVAARDLQRMNDVEAAWAERFGRPALAALRDALAGVLSERKLGGFVVATGLRPPPGGWRNRKPYLAQTTAVLRDPSAALPHFPTILHRGGWPDGS